MLIVAIKLILFLLKKNCPCGISVPYGTEAADLCRALLNFSTTLIDCAQHTALHASQSFCPLPCWGFLNSAQA